MALAPSAPVAAAVRRLLPRATIVVDHGHLVRLAHQAVTAVRQRIARAHRGRRGGKADPAWAHRRRPLAAADQLSWRGLARLHDMRAAADPTHAISAAGGVQKLLRPLLAAPTGHHARQRLFRVDDAVLTAAMPETTRLAETSSTWWPALEAFLRLRVTHARTAGTHRVLKQIKRVDCGYRNQAHDQHRIVLHIATKSAA